MCLILFAFQYHNSNPLVIAANRDETFIRPTRCAQFWPENPDLLAGKDLQEGGLWMGITRKGRFAAITNFRDPKAMTGSLSRGFIGKNFLLTDKHPEKFLQELSQNSSSYSGFNLLIGDHQELYYYSNRNKEISKLKSGIYGLSNNLLDSPWPKVTKGKLMLQEHLDASPDKDIQTEELIKLLQDKTLPADNLLPDTGIGLDYERVLSPLFIEMPLYGTRSSTGMTVSNQGKVTFHEQCYIENGIKADRSIIEFQLSD